ncbi:MAG: alpha/beta hydrolase [Candidatus Eremiobacteraeota bacterium]|nr:alpha/beta hydrolase [Candidatus Eremiobacteraeota bacterium]
MRPANFPIISCAPAIAQHIVCSYYAGSEVQAVKTKRVAAYIAFACALLVLSISALIAATRAQATPSFVPGACASPPQAIADLKHARCGRLIVPENRRRAGSPTISLSVAILPASSPRKKSDPIIWLAGGPGDDAITEIPMALAGKLNANRDVIFMSQRGTYTARPKLTCDPVDHWAAETLDMPYNAAETGHAYAVATLTCRNELLSKTSDLGAYNSLESADDLEALRVALHIPKWNVYGISYGTDLALTYMRQHPQGIRSVGIDGVFPPSLAGGAGAWKSAGEGINAVFKACAQQPRCRQRYGDIGATFRRLVLQYENSPKTVNVKVPGHPGTVKVKISGGMLVQWAVSPGTHIAAKLPASFDSLAHGDPTPIASTWAAPKLHPAGIGVLGNGLFSGVSCGEWVPYETEESVIAAGRRAFPMFPVSILKNAPNLPFMRENCSVWNVPKVSSLVRATTRSSIPTLVISAQYDAQTAPSFGPYAARTLPNATVVTIPNVAHVAFGSPSPAANACAYAIVRSFFDRLNKADTSCIRKVPATSFVINPQR